MQFQIISKDVEVYQSMPVYEYECGSCGGRFEAVRKFSDPDLSVCSLCNAENIRKVLSTPAFVLKGSGWYVTDYPTNDRKEGSALEKPPEKTSEKTKTEPKPSADCAAGTCAGACPAKG
jgi:putative FmdB family regulatory protein